MKLNCWEVKKCGHECNGINVGKRGVCPAAINDKSNGINFGTNGGRACWAIDGTFCNGASPQTFIEKISKCFICSFYNRVLDEEGKDFVPSLEIHERIGVNSSNRYI